MRWSFSSQSNKSLRGSKVITIAARTVLSQYVCSAHCCAFHQPATLGHPLYIT